MYDAVADLPLTVDAVAFDRIERETPAFARAATVVSLSGGGDTGRGEAVTYGAPHRDAPAEHTAETPASDALDLAGEYTFAAFSTTLDETDLWPVADPAREDYTRWGERVGVQQPPLDGRTTPRGLSACGREHE